MGYDCADVNMFDASREFPPQSVGIMLNVDDALLGLTVLSWGNSVGGMFMFLLHDQGSHSLQCCQDLISSSIDNECRHCVDIVADTLVARQGFPAMAVGAVYGGSMFSTSSHIHWK
jgi:hypothetical protein